MAGKNVRICGPCSGCCTVLRIDSQPGYSTRLDTGEDIAKPAQTPCRFLGEQGCTIYEARPIVCRTFQCDWLMKRKGFKQSDHPCRIGFFSIDGEAFFLPASNKTP